MIQSVILNTLEKYWYLIPIFLLVSLLKSRWFKGKLGEIQINNTLKSLTTDSEYVLLKNITLPANIGTTQIDHILVSPFGLFVIETKNLSGWIFGNEKQRNWTQQIYRNTYKFQNPLHQNFRHQKVLEEFMGLESDRMYSVVVFTNSSEFKTPMPENVLPAKKLIPYIKSKQARILTPEQCIEIKTAIESGQSPKGLGTDIKHVRSLKAKYSEKKLNETCPKCGSAMFKRTVKKGPHMGKDFMGCTGFPKCRFIVNLE